ncbi:transmembrane protein 69 [Plakobranchus ocellatus]|uniref:Transmembrane protein 69 n=1 Tax=Plakobranchus ocellatus TaxID=259542 RepID=A0AAV4ATS4_9GAST|nr:transmembrane protein 69 [Plakobranchus ocellatus]
MFSLTVSRACRVGSQTFFFHTLRQLSAGSHSLNHATQHTSVPSLGSAEQELRLKPLFSTSCISSVRRNAPARLPPAQTLHTATRTGVTSSPTTHPGPPSKPHDFPKSKSTLPVKSSIKTEGPFSFFSIRSLFSTPAPFMLYGLGGLIPFMSAPSYMYFTKQFDPTIAHAQLVYGACILSFLGGVSWGDHVNRVEKSTLGSLSYSILLPLIAWPAVLLYPNSGSFLIMISGIVYSGVKDTGSLHYPQWFKNLRFLLSSLVALSLSATLIFSFALKSKESDTDGDSDSSE